jgi:imidazolonepropionase-like amidohydrolase
MRGKGEDCCACGAALRGIGRVCDGVGECRRAARDELRRGAHCVKVMASGGVASPTDRRGARPPLALSLGQLELPLSR